MNFAFFLRQNKFLNKIETLKLIFHIQYLFLLLRRRAKFQVRQAVVDWLCNHTTHRHHQSIFTVFCARQSAGSRGAEPSSRSSCPLEACDVGGRRSWDTSKVLSCGWCYDGCVRRTMGFCSSLRKGKRKGGKVREAQKTEVGKAHSKQKARSVRWHSGVDMYLFGEWWNPGSMERGEMSWWGRRAPLLRPPMRLFQWARLAPEPYTVHWCLSGLHHSSASPVPNLLPSTTSVP